ITGVSSPRLLPLFFPVSESTELGRSFPSRVASATASLIAFLMRIWFTPTGVWTINVGMPVSWQIGPESSTAMSMLDKIMSNAWEDCVSGVSSVAAIFMAARTSGGRLVDVWVISSSKLPARNSISLPPQTCHFTLLWGGGLGRSPCGTGFSLSTVVSERKSKPDRLKPVLLNPRRIFPAFQIVVRHALVGEGNALV